MIDDPLDVDLVLPDGLKILLELACAEARAPRACLHIIRLKDAAQAANRSEAHVRRLAWANPHGIVPGGFGYKRDGERGREIAALPFLYTLPLKMIGRLKETRSWQTIKNPIIENDAVS